MTAHPLDPPDADALRAPPGAPRPPARPPGPLSAGECRAAAAVLRREKGVDERWRFASIELKEPAKDVVRAFTPGEPIRREARVTCWSREEGTAYKAEVSLTDDALLSWEAVPGEQPNMTLDEWHEAHDVLIQTSTVVEALAKRGITDLDLVLIDTWAYGHSLIPQGLQDRRVGWTDVWRRSVPGGNPYANPVNGLHFVVDLNTMELLRVEDTPPPGPNLAMGGERPSPAPRRHPLRQPRQRAALRRRPQHHGAAAGRGHPAAGAEPGDGRVRAVAGARPGAAQRPAAAGDHPARGPLLRPRPLRAAPAELDDAAGRHP